MDGLLADKGLSRTLAQVDVNLSNSMIEASWRSLKHAWLYRHSIDSMESLHRLVDFYVRQHNGRKRSFRVMPHAAFEGQTPDEMYFGRGAAVLQTLSAARIKAVEERIKANCVAHCGVCKTDIGSPALQLQRRALQNVMTRSWAGCTRST